MWRFLKCSGIYFTESGWYFSLLERFLGMEYKGRLKVNFRIEENKPRKSDSFNIWKRAASDCIISTWNAQTLVLWWPVSCWALWRDLNAQVFDHRLPGKESDTDLIWSHVDIILPCTKNCQEARGYYCDRIWRAVEGIWVKRNGLVHLMVQRECFQLYISTNKELWALFSTIVKLTG